MTLADYEFEGGCHSDECTDPTPWDMPCIIVGGDVYCSEECAVDNVSNVQSYEDEIVLHDPQYDVDRVGKIGHIEDDSVNIIRVVSDGEHVPSVIHEVCDLYPGEFRVGES